MALGARLVAHPVLPPRVAAVAVWATYLGGSVAFVTQKMRSWRTDY